MVGQVPMLTVGRGPHAVGGSGMPPAAYLLGSMPSSVQPLSHPLVFATKLPVLHTGAWVLQALPHTVLPRMRRWSQLQLAPQLVPLVLWQQGGKAMARKVTRLMQKCCTNVLLKRMRQDPPPQPTQQACCPDHAATGPSWLLSPTHLQRQHLLAQPLTHARGARTLHILHIILQQRHLLPQVLIRILRCASCGHAPADELLDA